MPDNLYDAIVIGSGISGGWAAKELCEKGLKVLMLERGRDIQHVKDYVNTGKAPWEFEHRGAVSPAVKVQYPKLSKEYFFDEIGPSIWPNELENPYTEVKPFSWFRSYQMGGRSLLWGRQSYRWNKWDFEANAKDGMGTDWPIRYEDIAPWYSYVEKFAGIQGNRDGLDVLPDGEFLPAMQMNCVEKDMAERLKQYYKGNRPMIIGRSANITQPKPEQNRVNCQYRDNCYRGCPFGAYFSTQSATLPAAMATKNLTVRPFSVVTKILYDKDSKKATGVEVLDTTNKQTYEYKSKIVFLNASTMNSAWVLMNSATDIWPDGLGSSSNELGHNIMDHHFRAGASGDVVGHEDKYYFGKRPTGIYIPRFRNIHDDKRNYLRGFGYQGGASRRGWSRDIPELTIGAAFKDALCTPGEWRFGMTGFGEMLPYHENKITLNREKTDIWGLPTLNMDIEIKDNERKMREDMKNDAQEILEAAGLKNVSSYNSDSEIGTAIHEMGSARMGKDPKTSVLNAYNQVWDAKNVFVTDGACMASSSCVNPSLTYMALTARAADYAVSELKKGNL